jgi:spermidine synthase
LATGAVASLSPLAGFLCALYDFLALVYFLCFCPPASASSGNLRGVLVERFSELRIAPVYASIMGDESTPNCTRLTVPGGHTSSCLRGWVHQLGGFESVTGLIEPTDRGLILASVAGLGVSCVVSQLVLLREMLVVFSGNEMILGVILGNWFLLAGLGAWIGRRADRLQPSWSVFAAGQILVALIPPLQVVALRMLWGVFFIHGAAVGITETVISSFILLLPFGLVSGYLLTLACSLLGRTEGPSGIGKIYVADALGSLAGGVLFSFWLVHNFDHFGLLLFPGFLNLVLAALLAFHAKNRTLAGVAVGFAAALLVLSLAADIDAVTTARQYPQQNVVFYGNSPYGRLVVSKSGGQINFVENGVPLFSTHNVEQVEETVHYAMTQRPEAENVLLISGGTGGTAREILKYGVKTVTYAELDPLILKNAVEYFPSDLGGSRIKLVSTDGRLYLRQTVQKFDVIIVNVPEPSTSQLNRFYTAEFFREVKAALTTGGVVSFALGHYENYVSRELARLLSSAYQTLRNSFAQVLAIPGERVFFLASDGPLGLDIAARLEHRRIPTQFVNRHYLDAALSPDRLDDVRRATTQAAAINRDFSPILYYYQFLYWISQFKVRFGLLEALLLVLFVVCLARLNRAQFAIFASGFAGSVLELVLLLGFQILYGSLYYQMAIIITCFMAGLAVGAFWMSGRPIKANRMALAALCLGVGFCAALVPWVLRTLGHLGATEVSMDAGRFCISALTFVVAISIGMEFPLAGRVQFGGVAPTASGLYTADFMGACLGALLASTFLIPLAGVTTVCLLTAGLNIVAAAVVGWGKSIA